MIDAGADLDTINLLGSGEGSLADFINVETINLVDGTWTLGSEGVTTLAFQAGAQTLRLDADVLADGSFTGTIDNFVAGDAIGLAGIGLATSTTLGAGNLLDDQWRHRRAVTLQLDAGEDYTGFVFRLTSDGNGGTTITLGKNVNGGNGNDSLPAPRAMTVSTAATAMTRSPGSPATTSSSAATATKPRRRRRQQRWMVATAMTS